MEMVAFNIGTLRSAAAVLRRLLCCMPVCATLHLDYAADYYMYDVLLALANGWIGDTPNLSALALHHRWLAGVFCGDRVGVVQLHRTSQGNQKRKDNEANSSRWKHAILSALLAEVAAVVYRNAPLQFLRVAHIPKAAQMGCKQMVQSCNPSALPSECVLLEWLEGPCKSRMAYAWPISQGGTSATSCSSQLSLPGPA